MRLSLSRPLLALLLAVLVVSIVTSLRPPQDAAVGGVEADLLPPEKSGGGSAADDVSWERAPYKLKQDIRKSEPAVKAATVVLVSSPESMVPSVPDSGFTYIGRMIRDGKVYAFVGKDDEVEIVAAGDGLGQEWRLDTIGSQSLTVRYLPLNETRIVAMSHDR